MNILRFFGALAQPMRRSAGLAACCMALALALGAPGAHAGQNCEGRKPTPQTVTGGLDLAAKTLAALDASGNQVVLLARAGQDLSRYGLRYSHLGWAYRQIDPQGRTSWRVLHKLNECGTSNGAIYRQGLGEFFLDDLWRFEAAWIVPTPEVQTRMLALLQQPVLSLSLNHRPYSVVSYAWGRTYQQSNQWAIETLALAMEPQARSREQAQAWLQFKGYQPTALQIGPMTRLGGRVGSANVAFDDHPSEKRFADRIETVTVDSIFEWLPRAQMAPSAQGVTVVKL
jgi:hypothetical protein